MLERQAFCVMNGKETRESHRSKGMQLSMTGTGSFLHSEDMNADGTTLFTPLYGTESGILMTGNETS